jgi:L-ascorbate metabolism protein UlaG (beta-lactamase superfamily)
MRLLADAMTSRHFLKPSVRMEPLVCRWYAWPHLVSPATAALNIARRHLPIMKSYVEEPEIHASAVEDPSMLGGPFVDHGGERVNEMRCLIEATRDRCASQLALANDIDALETRLQTYGDGRSLEPLYAELPDSLRGMVELVYDTHHRPSVRYLEPLMYRSRLYDESLQSLVFDCSARDERKFVLSTPRLEDESTVFANVPFRSSAVDRLFAMREHAADVDDIVGMFEPLARGGRDALIERLFTTVVPRRREPYRGPGVRVRYFGHACVLVETGRVSILVDPVVSYDYPSSLQRFTCLDIPEQIDYVLLTHNHQDHVMLETLLQLRHKVGTVLVPSSATGSLQDPSLALMLRTLGFKDVRSLDMLDEMPVPGGRITALPFLGEHSDLRIDGKAAWLVDVDGRRIVFAADSRNLSPAVYELISPLVAPVDLLFIGMECDGAPLSWLYGPLVSRPLPRTHDDARSLSGSDAAMAGDIVRRFDARRVFVYAMGQEPWLNHVMCLRYTPDSPPLVESDRLIAECRVRGIAAERLFGSRELVLA